MSSNSDNETQNAKNKLNKLEMDTLEEELRPKGVGDAVWEKLQEAKKQGKKVRLVKKKKTKDEKKKKEIDMSPVEIAGHLSIWSALYHMLWSGEIQHFRQGVLTDLQATTLCFFCLIVPFAPVLSMGIAFVCVRRIFATGIAGDIGTVVFAQFLRTTLISMATTDDGKAFMHLLELDKSVVVIVLYFIDVYIACTFAYSWLSIGQNWDAYHGTKMAIFLVVFSFVHNPIYGIRHVLNLPIQGLSQVEINLEK